MRTVLAAALLATVVGAARAGDAPAAKAGFTGRVSDRSRICMMQDSMQPKAGLKHEYGGKTYWLCCQMCVQAFDGAPERYAHAKDPVNGQVVDKATAPAFALNGKAFFFSSEKTLKAFAAEPSRFVPGG